MAWALRHRLYECRRLRRLGDKSSPTVGVTLRDERCAMVNLDLDTAAIDTEVMKTVVRMNGNYAGVYGTVVKAGELRVGQVVTLAG